MHNTFVNFDLFMFIDKIYNGQTSANVLVIHTLDAKLFCAFSKITSSSHREYVLQQVTRTEFTFYYYCTDAYAIHVDH